MGNGKFNLTETRYTYGRYLQNTHRRLKSPLVSILIVLVLVVLATQRTKAQLPFEETFRNSTAEGFFFGGNPNPAILTAPSIDSEGNGVLRLTNNENNQTGFAYSSGVALPSAGLHIEFEYFTYGGNGADGIVFFLFDASADPFQIGGFGGSLGYAQRSTNLPGVSKAYLGIGLDEYGNFSNPSENRQGGPGRRAQSVTLRGAGNGSAATSNNYPYLTHVQVSQAPYNFNIEGGGTTRTTDPTNNRYRKVIIKMKPRNGGGFFIDMDIIRGGTPQQVHSILTNFVYTTPAPDAFKLGFSAGSGGNNNFHEIRNLKISALDTSHLQSPTAYGVTASTCVNEAVNINIVSNVSVHGVEQNFANMHSIDLDPDMPGQQTTLHVPGQGVFHYNKANQRLSFSPDPGFQGKATTRFTIRDAYGMESNVAEIAVDVSEEFCMDCFTTTGFNNVFGMVFNDSNANGNTDSGETGMEGSL